MYSSRAKPAYLPLPVATVKDVFGLFCPLFQPTTEGFYYRKHNTKQMILPVTP